MSAAEAPVLLGRICSSWRAISLTTPRLWSRLHIVEPSPSHSGSHFASDGAILEEKLAQRLETTQIWLGRSGQCPLSISLHGSHWEHLQGDVLVSKTPLFMGAIIPFTSRWENITLRVASTTVLETLSGLTENDVPRLQRLVLGFPGETTPQPMFSLLRAPRLSDFTLESAQANIQHLPIRWENLTHLSLRNFHTLTCPIVLQLLSSSSQLQCCSFHFNEQVALPLVDGAGSTIALPFLHSLQISSLGQVVNGIEILFGRLLVVRLRHLHLSGHLGIGLENLESSFTTHLLTFLGVSSCFETLKIDTSAFNTSSLTDLLRGLPSSTTCLRIDDGHSWGFTHRGGIFDDAAMAVLTPTPENPVSCPVLQELRIANCTFASDAALLRFIRARLTASPNTLKKVMIKCDREMQVDIGQDIKPFLDDGRIRVVTRYAQPRRSFSPWQGLPDAPEMVKISRIIEGDV
ncbi:hypothetical protein B0H16DRAFT_1529275 [Mycena metata]|uniref:F-box domain-containing protein n=1 Tax=Mycena metata TaxID=1033252 RepID=A0AAD7NHL7_9AGAR|nr:hypothetical protein B0H16DRAFT_1529275 [Mycena metata]